MKRALRVRDIMTRPTTVIRDVDPIDRAGLTMQVAECHHLPVVDDRGLLVGILSARDIARPGDGTGGDAASPTRVADVMHPHVVTIRRGAPAALAAALLVEHGIGCVAVVDAHGAPVGIISAVDILQLAERALDGKRIRPRQRPAET